MPEALRAIAQVMRDAFGTPALRRVQFAFAAVSLGHWAGLVALSVYAFNEAGAAAVGLVALAKMLPAALATPFTSLLADRTSRRDVMLASALLRAAFGLGMAAAILAGLPLAAVVVLAALQAIAGTPYRPAQAALLPQLATSPQQMAAANAVWNGVDSTGFILGALAGGWAIGALAPEEAFALLALPYAAAALLLATIARDPVPVHREVLEGALVRDELLLGYRTVLDRPQLRTVVGLLTASKLVEGAIDTLVVLVALDLLDLTDAAVGYLNAAWGVGGIAGMVVALALLRSGNLAFGLAGGCLAIGVPLIALGVIAATPAAVLALLIVGVGYALVEIAGETLMQRLTSDEILGRVFGVMESTYLAATGIGAALAPVIAHVAGIRGALVIVGLALPLLALLRWSALARYEAGVEVPAAQFALLRGVPLFAPLPVATVENLTLRLRPVPVEPGSEIITQGEEGDRFYVIDEGDVEVLVDGRRVRVEHAGEFFGEIALLHGIPRTATVRALGPGLLYALERDDFIVSVTGNPRSVLLATSVINERIDHAAA